MSSSAKVTRPSSSDLLGVERLADFGLRGIERVGLAEKARRQPRKAVAHGVDAGEIRVAQHDRGGRAVVALHGADQHVGAVGSEGQLGERAGKARAGLDQGHQRARGHVDALEHAPPLEADFAREPVRGIRVEEGVIGEHAPRIAVRLEHDGRDLQLVEPDVEDRVVQLARELERPEGRALLHHLVGRGGRGTLRAAQRDRGEAVVALERDRDELVFVGVEPRVRSIGVSAMPFSGLPFCFAAMSLARFSTDSSSFERGITSSTSRQSTARLPFTPSSVVQNTSA